MSVTALNGTSLKPRGLLIDFDGTIVDASRAYAAAAETALAELGYYQRHVSVEIGREIARRLESGQFGAKLVDGLIDVRYLDHRRFISMWVKVLSSRSDLFTPIDDTRLVLKTLSQTYPLALVSNRKISETFLEKLGLRNVFRANVSGSREGPPKPAPAKLVRASSLLGLPANHLAMIGDSPVDIRAGKAAGTATLAVTCGLYDGNALLQEKLDDIARDLADVARRVLGCQMRSWTK